MECLDSKGLQLQPGDVVEVTVKYVVLKVYDKHVLAISSHSQITKSKDDADSPEGMARLKESLNKGGSFPELDAAHRFALRREARKRAALKWKQGKDWELHT